MARLTAAGRPSAPCLSPGAQDERIGLARRDGLVDPFGRRIDYLRLSVTDRCNLRCVYCLPETASAFTPSAETLSNEEVLELAACFAELGFSKIRVTGGEPLVRPGIVELVGGLAELPGVSDLSMSTNGMLLAPLAAELARRGLRRINISLDTLDAGRFQSMTRHGRLDAVLEGVEGALLAGLSPVKLNVVVARGSNEDEIASFARLAFERPVHVRFIELMPMGETGFFSWTRRVCFSEMLGRAGPLEPLPREEWPAGNGPARYYRRPGARGTVGFITALSCGFCHLCNRVRLSARGTLVACLDGDDGAALGVALRAGAGREGVQRMILDVIGRKPERHHMLEREAWEASNPRTMCQIGG